MPLLPESWTKGIQDLFGIKPGQHELTDDQRDLLNQALDDYDKSNEDLRDAGFNFLDELLTGGTGLQLNELYDTINSLQELMDELEDADTDPEDWKTRVFKGSDVFEAMNNFRTENLFNFYKDKLTEIKDDLESNFSSDNFAPILKNLKAGDLSSSLNSILSAVNGILSTALDIADLFKNFDNIAKDLQEKVLSQAKPEVALADATGRLTRNP